MAPLRQIRRKQRLRARDLAAKADVAAQTIYRIEGGRGTAMPETIRRICLALEVTPYEVDEFKKLLP